MSSDAAVTSLPAVRFIRRLQHSKQQIEELTSMTKKAQHMLASTNEKLRLNTENQRLVTQFLAAGAAARSGAKPRVRLTLAFSNPNPPASRDFQLDLSYPSKGE